MNKKKAQGLSFSMIIVASLGLLVLIVVGLIFRGSIISYAKGYQSTAENALSRANEESCTSFTNSRICSDAPKTGYREVSGDFPDCKGDKCYEPDGSAGKDGKVKAK